MDRRIFLASLIAGLTVDPERLLWTPRKKLISIPAPRAASLKWGDIITIEERYAVNPLTSELTGDLQKFVVCRDGRLRPAGSLLACDTPELERQWIAASLKIFDPKNLERLRGWPTASPEA